MLRITTVALVMVLCAGTRAELIRYADMRDVANVPAVIAFEAQLRAAGDSDEIMRLAQSIESVIEPLEQKLRIREHLRVAVAKQFARMPATPASTDWLRGLSQSKVQIQVAHEHAGHITPLPAYDPAAVARYALAQQAERRSAASMGAALMAGNGFTQTVTNAERNKARASLQPSLYVKVVHQLDDTTLAREIDTWVALLDAQPELGASIVAAAQRLQQPALLLAVIRRGTSRDARAALDAAHNLEPHHDRRPLLRAAIARKDIASIGLMALAQSAQLDPTLATDLLNYLHQPAHASAAAAAIAAHARPALMAQIARELNATDDADLGAALALCLSLMSAPEARAALLAWSEKQGPLQSLRAKIRQAYAGGAQ